MRERHLGVRDRKKAFIDKRATLQSAILDFHPLGRGGGKAVSSPRNLPLSNTADAHVS